MEMAIYSIPMSSSSVFPTKSYKTYSKNTVYKSSISRNTSYFTISLVKARRKVDKPLDSEPCAIVC